MSGTGNIRINVLWWFKIFFGTNRQNMSLAIKNSILFLSSPFLIIFISTWSYITMNKKKLSNKISTNQKAHFFLEKQWQRVRLNTIRKQFHKNISSKFT